MRVIAAVAGDAGAWISGHGFHSLEVAGVAMNLLMRAVDAEFTLEIVIETPHLPAVWCMATLALDAERSLMWILVFVACVAVARGLLIDGA